MATQPFIAADAPAETLRSDVAGGVRWSLFATVVNNAGRLAFAVVLMRLLGPENFGIVGQATVYIMITGIFLDLGLAATIIQRPRLDRVDVGSAVWLNLLIGSGLAGLTVVAAPVLASFFHTPELAWVLRVLAASFVLRAFAVVPAALLTRSMRFRSLGSAEILSTFVGGAIGIVAAANGAGYWALVVQTLTFDGLYLALLLRVTGRPAMAWSGTAVRRLWSFSSRVMGADLINYVSDNGDKFLIARFLGATPLALYSLGARVLVLPVQTLGQTANRVIFPTFSRLQHDRERLARFFLDATEALGLAVFPMMVLAVVAAPLAVPVVFGEAWQPAVVPLQLLAMMGIPRLLASVTGPVVLAAGRADWELRWSIATTIVAFIGFAIGLHWGIVGVAVSFAITGTLLTPFRFLQIRRLIPISAAGYLRSLAPAATCSVVLVGTWFLASGVLDGNTSDLGVLVGASIASLAAYAIAAGLLWRSDLSRQLDFARLVVRPRAA